MYEFWKGKKIVDAVKSICDAFGQATVSIWTCEKWYANLERGDFDIEDEPCSGWSTVVDDNSIRAIVISNPRISTEKIAKSLNSTANRGLRKSEHILQFNSPSFIDWKKNVSLLCNEVLA